MYSIHQSEKIRFRLRDFPSCFPEHTNFQLHRLRPTLHFWPSLSDGSCPFVCGLQPNQFQAHSVSLTNREIVGCFPLGHKLSPVRWGSLTWADSWLSQRARINSCTVLITHVCDFTIKSEGFCFVLKFYEFV